MGNSASLFRSRAWKDAWWQQWGATKGLKFLQRGADGESDLYLDRYRIKGILPVTCLNYVGSSYRRLSTPRTEYNCLSADSSEPLRKRLEFVEGLKWSEAVLKDVCADSAELQAIEQWAAARGWGWRVVHEDIAYSVQACGDFQEYLANLGSSTRLKLYNRRKILEGLGTVTETNLWPDDAGRFFDLLNGFHEARWGGPCFNPDSLAFHRRFLANVESEGGGPELMLLALDGKPLSVLYNVRFGERTYNIQSGYAENFHKKVALGTVHLGYAIERAFRSAEVESFDLLAGGGKNTNYKKHLATDTQPLVSLMIVRSPLFRLIYRLKAWLQKK